MFKIGQKIVCIDDVPRKPPSTPTLRTPKVGITYTIRDIYESKSNPGQVALILKEIINLVNETFGHELGFSEWRFKPLIEDGSWAESVLEKVIEKEALAWLVE
tara:strand:- start:540 stop:848 length:309 start_codon:yes stop_codon:yes gene_type:complete